MIYDVRSKHFKSYLVARSSVLDSGSGSADGGGGGAGGGVGEGSRARRMFGGSV